MPNGDLDYIGNIDFNIKKQCDSLKASIKNAKKLFNNHFYFLYHPMDLSNDPWIKKDKEEVAKQTARNIEGATKEKLATRGIHTGSDAKKHFDDEVLKKNPIDLSAVDDVLVLPPK